MKARKNINKSLWLGGLGALLAGVSVWGQVAVSASELYDITSLLYSLMTIGVFAGIVMIIISTILFTIAISASSKS